MEKSFQIRLASSDEDIRKVFKIREDVFVVEQQVDRSEEYDEFEKSSYHILAYDSDEEPVGCSRWRKTDKGIKLERFAVIKSWRGRGVGSGLVQFTLDHIEELEGTSKYLYLHAQIDAMPLYKKFGFQKKGEMFIECDIQHFTMFKQT